MTTSNESPEFAHLNFPWDVHCAAVQLSLTFVFVCVFPFAPLKRCGPPFRRPGLCVHMISGQDLETSPLPTSNHYTVTITEWDPAPALKRETKLHQTALRCQKFCFQSFQETESESQTEGLSLQALLKSKARAHKVDQLMSKPCLSCSSCRIYRKNVSLANFTELSQEAFGCRFAGESKL